MSHHQLVTEWENSIIPVKVAAVITDAAGMHIKALWTQDLTSLIQPVSMCMWGA